MAFKFGKGISGLKVKKKIKVKNIIEEEPEPEEKTDAHTKFGEHYWNSNDKSFYEPSDDDGQVKPVDGYGLIPDVYDNTSSDKGLIKELHCGKFNLGKLDTNQNFLLVGCRCSLKEENLLKKHGLETKRPEGTMLWNPFICKQGGLLYRAFFDVGQNKALYYIDDNQVNDTSQFPEIFKKIFPEYVVTSKPPIYDNVKADISKMLAEWEQKDKDDQKEPDEPQPENNNNNNNINNDSDKKNMVFVANQNNVAASIPNNNNVPAPMPDNSNMAKPMPDNSRGLLNNNRNKSRVLLTTTTTAKNNTSLKKGNEDQNNQKTQSQTQGNKDGNQNQNQTQSTTTPVSPQSEDKNNKQNEDSKQGSQNNNKAEQKSYIPSFVLGAGSGIGVIVGIIAKNNKVVAIVSLVTAGLCGAGCAFHSIWAYTHNKEVNNKNPSNNIDNAQKKGQEKA